MTTSFSLPARLDTAAAQPLAASLGERIAAGGPIELNGGDVETIGQACLQILLGARRTAQAKGLEFGICYPSGALIESCVLADLETLVRPA